jgi:hypothetical protein
MIRSALIYTVAATALGACCNTTPQQHRWVAPGGKVYTWTYAPRTEVVAPDGADCDSDCDCTDKPGGRCGDWRISGVPLEDSRYCRYGECLSDGDCKGGSICVPALRDHGFSRCIRSWCTSDSECRAGGKCRMMYGAIGCFYPDDVCNPNKPCARNAQSMREQLCAFRAGGHGTMCVNLPEPPP